MTDEQLQKFEKWLEHEYEMYLWFMNHEEINSVNHDYWTTKLSQIITVQEVLEKILNGK